MGLFTTQFVAAGALLLCEKAFAFCGSSSGPNSNPKIVLDFPTGCAVRDWNITDLPVQILHKLLQYPWLAEKIFCLHGGHETPIKWADDRPVLDSYVMTIVSAVLLE